MSCHVPAYLLAVLLVAPSLAEPPHPEQESHSSAQTLERAGNPQVVAPYAKPSVTPAYVGYYVGGGSVCDGDPRYRWEGTWGWDYCGWHLHSVVALGWWHGRRYQGGTGAYQPNGPKLCEKK
jgi:hypothetical protein